MTRSLEAVVEGGMLKPLDPLNLPDGSRVNLFLTDHIDDKQPAVGPTPADIIASIADLPEEDGPIFTARDHDAMLYGNANGCR